MAGGGTRGRKAASVVTPPSVPVVGDVRGLIVRGISGNGDLVARQPFQGKIRHLSNLRLRVLERGEQGGDHFLGAQVFQTENGVHPVRDLGRVQIVEEQLVGPRVVKESEGTQDVAPHGLYALGEHLHEGGNKRRVSFLRQ